MKKWIAVLLALCLLFAVTACGADEPVEVSDPEAPEEAPEAVPQAEETGMDEWVVYWYLCGSDLESEGGFASGDLQEMLEVQLPENVKVVIETGGSSQWQNNMVDASKLQRWLYSSEGFQLIDEQPSASMGEAQTLAEFLDFAKTNFPGNKTAVVFWNHGGGSVSGAAFDELYENDSLKLDEMYQAFSAVFGTSEDNQPLELIGFDTCLMATVDVANTFTDIAKYMVASEETEPANGWYYSEWLGALAEDPYQDGEALGKIICDSYYRGCEEIGTEQSATLSLTDLTRARTLLDAYDAFGAECLAAACEDPGFFSQFARVAQKSENYGGNTREQGYTNMVDLGDLARKSADLVPSSQNVLSALNDCVLYQVGGPYRAEASGLSCYYSYNADAEDYAGYAALGAGEAFKHFYYYELSGELSDDSVSYLENLDFDSMAEMDFNAMPEVQNLITMGYDGAKLDLNDEGTAFMTLGAEANDILAGIGFQLFYMDEASDTMMLLGTDNDMNADWENGVFSDNFRGVWGAIDGCLVYMELSDEGDGYNVYSVPVLLNGEEYNLQVAYDFAAEEWTVLGARQGIDESGMADKELRLLQVGDEITTIWKMASVSGDDDFEMYTNETVTYTAGTQFGEAPLFDGTYRMVFEMWDAMGNYAYSDPVQFDCVNGEITTTVFE